MNILFRFCKLALLLALFQPAVSRATSLTVVVTNLPAWSEFADGQAIALVGSINGWNNNATLATVVQHRLVYSLGEIGTLSALGSDWVDLFGGENIGFQFVAPGTWTGRIKTDFRSNEGNFRLALQNGASNLVEINAGPVPTLIDQDTAAAVNGVRADNKTLVDPTRFAYPGGRWKALIMSYDDGHVQDRGLAPIFSNHGIRGTFHLNTGWFDTDTFLASAEIPTLFAGDEISIHTVDHPDLTQVGDGTVQWEVGHCRYVLEGLAGYEVKSMSYPLGTYDRRVMNLTASQGVTCSRTVQAANSLDFFPPNYLKWHPTCHHADADWFADQLLSRSGETLSLLFIWGHSYELDYGYSNNSWAYMDALCSKLGDRGDIWYSGAGEMQKYLAAAQAVSFTSNVVHNPSGDVTVWTVLNGLLGRIRPGSTLAYPPGRVTVNPELLYENGVATISYRPEGNGLAGATGLWVHIGHDGWQQTHDLQMTNDGTGRWRTTYAVSNGVRQLNWVFFNNNGIWDDALGSDWSAPVRAATTGMPAQVQLMPGSPVLQNKTTGDQNNGGDAFDLDMIGGALSASNQGGFGSFGNVYLNYDETNLYIGGTGVQMGGNNNGMIIFLSLDTLADGVENLWNIRGTPRGLDYLHNIAIAPKANIAIVIGDEYGDGTFAHFDLDSGYDFGQGVYHLSTNSAYLVPVRGAQLSQYDGTGTTATMSGDDDGNRQTDRWEAAIPWNSLNAPLGIRSLGACYVSGVIAGAGISGNDRYLSANYLGAAATGTLNGEGNFGFNFVQLAGQPVGLPNIDSDLDMMPDQWTIEHFQHPLGQSNDYSRADDDADGDGQNNVAEFRSGTDPTNAASLFAVAQIKTAQQFQVTSVAGRYYRVQYTTNLAAATPWTDWAAPILATGAVTTIDIPVDFPAACLRAAVISE